jgi:hypothetical protein
MRRARFLICAALLLGVGGPPVVMGQALGDAPREVQSVRVGRLGITPLLGVRAPLVSQRRATVIVPGGFSPLVVVFDGRGGDGGTVGAEVDLRLVGPVGVAAALTFSNPDEVLTTVRHGEGTISQNVLKGPTVAFARLNLIYELRAPHPEDRNYRPAAFVMIGPAVAREDYGHGMLALSDGADRVDNPALHVGIKALMPFGSPSLVLHLSAENYATFWNPRDQERRRVERLLELQPGTATSTGFDYNTTHVFMFNVGLSLRL